MQVFFSDLFSYLLLYKYLTLFVVSYLATFSIPLPSNSILLASATFASQGYLNIYIVLLVAFLANVLGDITGFLISHLYGKKILYKIGLEKAINSAKYHKLEKFIVSNSKTTIFVTRFIGGACSLVNIIAGHSSDISFKRFLLYTSIGEFIYVTTLTLLGYFLGSLWQTVGESVELVSVGGIILIVIYVTYIMFHKKD